MRSFQLSTYPGVVSQALFVLFMAAVVLTGVPDGVVLSTGPSMLSYTEPVRINSPSSVNKQQSCNSHSLALTDGLG